MGPVAVGRGRADADADATVASAFIAYSAVGWFLSGLGAVLAEVRDSVGSAAGLYPLMPGVAMVVLSTVAIRRPRVHHDAPRPLVVPAATAGLAAGAVVMGITASTVTSLIGAACAGVATAALVRTLTGVLAAARPADTSRVIMRANAWSSLASIVSPAAIGGAIAVGIGWRIGLALPLTILATLTLRTLGVRAKPFAAPTTASAHDTATGATTASGAASRPWARAWLLLTIAIVVEFCFAYFVTTFLRDVRHFSSAAAATSSMAWGIGMTAGRFLLGSRPSPFTRSIVPSAVVVLAGFVLFWAVDHPVVSVAGIVVAGLGAAPQYPMLVTALMSAFAASPAQGSARGSLASGMALTAAPALMVGLRAAVGLRGAYLAVPALLAVLVLLARPQRRPS